MITRHTIASALAAMIFSAGVVLVLVGLQEETPPVVPVLVKADRGPLKEPVKSQSRVKVVKTVAVNSWLTPNERVAGAFAVIERMIVERAVLERTALQRAAIERAVLEWRTSK